MQLLESLNQHARNRPDALAFCEVDGDGTVARSLTYRAYASAVATVSEQLSRRFEKQSTLIVQLTNQVAYPVVYLAALSADLQVFPLHPSLTSYEVQQAAEQTNAVGIVSDGPGCPELTHITPREIREWIDQAGEAAVPVHSTLSSMLLQSSGTTGLPKVVRRSSASIDAVARNVVQAVGLTEDDQVIAAIPLCHSYGIENGLAAPLLAGAIVYAYPGFDPHVIATLWSKLNRVVLPAVPIMVDLLATTAGLQKPGQTLRQIYSAGAILPSSVSQRFFDRYHQHVGQLYGATEIGSVTFASGGPEGLPPGCVGIPMHDVSIRILDIEHPQTKPTIPAGEVGQIAIQSPSMLDAYHDQSELPLIDGHYLTGDLGHLDELGRLTITGRVKTLIEVGGMKVNAMEVERVLAEHPDVAECAVVSVQITDTLSRLTAFIVAKRPSAQVDTGALRAHAKERLAAYKVPRAFEFVPRLPRTSLGKVQRRLLMETEP